MLVMWSILYEDLMLLNISSLKRVRLSKISVNVFNYKWRKDHLSERLDVSHDKHTFNPSFIMNSLIDANVML